MGEKKKLHFDDLTVAFPAIRTGKVKKPEEITETEEKIEELKDVLDEISEEPKKSRKLTLDLEKTVAVPEVEILLKHLK